AAFLAMLASVRPDHVPFRALPWRPRVHLVLFVHRVDDMTPGIWCLVRDADARPALAAAMRADLLWDAPDRETAALGLCLLAPIDCRSAGRAVSCHQDIAADGAFAVAMLAEFEAPLRELGAWFYRRLHWETGAVGQVLYLAAEAAGVRATGIGCFFDDTL